MQFESISDVNTSTLSVQCTSLQVVSSQSAVSRS